MVWVRGDAQQLRADVPGRSQCLICRLCATIVPEHAFCCRWGFVCSAAECCCWGQVRFSIYPASGWKRDTSASVLLAVSCVKASKTGRLSLLSGCFQGGKAVFWGTKESLNGGVPLYLSSSRLFSYIGSMFWCRWARCRARRCPAGGWGLPGPGRYLRARRVGGGRWRGRAHSAP